GRVELGRLRSDPAASHANGRPMLRTVGNQRPVYLRAHFVRKGLHHCTHGSATKHSSCIQSTRTDPVIVLTTMYSSMTPLDLPQPLHTGASLCSFNSQTDCPSSVSCAR